MQYSDNFLRTMTEVERRMFLGNDVPVGDEDDEDDRDSSQGDIVGDEGWAGAVVAVLGLFDKGEPCLLNRAANANSSTCLDWIYSSIGQGNEKKCCICTR